LIWLSKCMSLRLHTTLNLRDVCPRGCKAFHKIRVMRGAHVPAAARGGAQSNLPVARRPRSLPRRAEHLRSYCTGRSAALKFCKAPCRSSNSSTTVCLTKLASLKAISLSSKLFKWWVSQNFMKVNGRGERAGWERFKINRRKLSCPPKPIMALYSKPISNKIFARLVRHSL